MRKHCRVVAEKLRDAWTAATAELLFMMLRISSRSETTTILDTVRTMWYWELCQRWRTIRLLLSAQNMILAHIPVTYQLNRLYGICLQCHWSLCWSDSFLSMLFGIFRCFYCTFIEFYSVYCVLLPYGVINDDSEVYAVCYRPSVRPAPA